MPRAQFGQTLPPPGLWPQSSPNAALSTVPYTPPDVAGKLALEIGSRRFARKTFAAAATAHTFVQIP